METVAAAMANHSPRCSRNLTAAGTRSTVTTAMQAIPHISHCAKLIGTLSLGQPEDEVEKTSHPAR
jgi:hypothetical protein